MEISEFIEANNRLEDYYEKEYTAKQTQIMFEELKTLSVERYIKLISQCIKTCKFLPKVADILKANGELIETSNDSKIEKVACNKCDTTGYVVYTQFIVNGNERIPYTFAARCICDNAKYLNKKIPTYQELGIQIGTRHQQIKDMSKEIEKVKQMLKI